MAGQYRNNRNNQYNNHKNSDTNGNKYVGAPYNFVPFPEEIMKYSPEDLPKQNATGSKLISGEINYTIEAKNDILIDDGTGHFYKNAQGQYAIPGSSLRGLIRSNVQVLSHSDHSMDIDDYSLMFRKVGGKGQDKNKRFYESILGAQTIRLENGTKSSSVSILEKVRAGYVRNENGEFKIYDVNGKAHKDRGEMNYYVLSEGLIWREYKKIGNSNFKYDFFKKDNKWKTQYNIGSIRKEPTDWDKDDKNLRYEPYYEECSFETDKLKVIAVKEPGKLSKNGYVVSTGFMNKKKAVYLIPEPVFDITEESDFPITIPKKDVKAFEVDLKKRETTLKTFGGKRHFDLPRKNGEFRPVFYIFDQGRLYFGFTPRLRVFYDHTIAEGLPRASSAKLDYARALFGVSNDTDTFKTRLSFGDALVTSETAMFSPKISLIQGEPKASSYLDYLLPENENTGMTYNENDFRLRGAKHYWLRDKTINGNVSEDKANEKYVSHLYPLSAGARFTGKIRFRNLKKEELGLLLWALMPSDSTEMNIGKAKAFGYGRIKLKVDSVDVMNDKVAYGSIFSLTPMDKVSDETLCEWVEAFKQQFTEKTSHTPENDPTIATFLLMKDSTHMPATEKIRYMNLGQKEYQSRTKPLAFAKDVVGIEMINMSGMTRTTNATSSSKDTAHTAEVYKVSDYGDVFLKKDEIIPNYAKVPKGPKSKNLKAGDKICVRFVRREQTKRGESFIYEIIE